LKTKIVYSLISLLVIAGAALFFGYQWLSTLPEARTFSAPGKTAWVPEGPRKAGDYGHKVIPEPDAFHTMHVGMNNTDNIWIAAAPMVAFDWVAETGMYVAEGPTFDNDGGLYFSPYNPKEDVSLVCLDRETGKRRWTVPGRGTANGAILILNDPDRPGRQVIYHSTYTRAMALQTDGTIIWEALTGLIPPDRQPGDRDYTHTWGMNYHPQADAVVGVSMDGFVYAHDRKTGAPLLREPFQLPGAPAVIAPRPPAWIRWAANRETDKVFGRTTDGMGMFTAIVDVIFGSGFDVANYYAVDPNTGRLYIAATAPDEQDGRKDGVSQNGALYLLELTGQQAGGYELQIVRYYAFEGGTGSTPTVSPNSDRVMVSDDNGNVIALDKDLNELWRINVGAQVAASIAVSPDNNEIYAVNKFDIYKITDQGNTGEIAWRAMLDAYPGFHNFNALTPTITANGLAVSVGGGRRIGDDQVMLRVGAGLLDRETGKLRYFAQGREDSISITSIGPDGGYYTAGSPVRRAVGRGLIGGKLPPLVGGIQRYKPIRLDLLVRDAACAAAARAENARHIAAGHPKSVRDDILQIGALARQCRWALQGAVHDKDMSLKKAFEISDFLHAAESRLTVKGLSEAAKSFENICMLFE
jgi:outer membrane protein assembly factor BamB